MLNQFLQCDEVMNFSLYEIVRHNVAIKRGGVMIMHFDSRLPRQERLLQKKKKEWRKREREKIDAMLPLCHPLQQGNEQSICIAAYHSLLISTLHLSPDEVSGGTITSRAMKISLFLYWFNVQLSLYFKIQSNGACSLIIKHELETLWYTALDQSWCINSSETNHFRRIQCTEVLFYGRIYAVLLHILPFHPLVCLL